MKSIITPFIIALVAFATMAACTDDTPNNQRFGSEWRQKNEQQFAAIATNPEYTELKSPGNNGSIYYKVLKQGDGTQPIYYTSTVALYFKGMYTVTHGNRKAGDVVEQLVSDKNPEARYSVATLNESALLQNGNIARHRQPEGWQIALQHMKKGDRWEIWIPYRLGFGAADTYFNEFFFVEGYTTLKYELEVVDVAS